MRARRSVNSRTYTSLTDDAITVTSNQLLRGGTSKQFSDERETQSCILLSVVERGACRFRIMLLIRCRPASPLATI